MAHESNGIPEAAQQLFDVGVHDELLRSTVRLARLAFGARAASVFVYNEQRDELVFEASSGAGEDRLVGIAISPDSGIAGWVWNTGETMIVRDLTSDGRFDVEFARNTGYVPDSIMAAPLASEGEQLGVLEVLDAGTPMASDLAAMDLLGEVAAQCSAAISLLRAARVLEPSLAGRYQAEPLLRLEAALTRTGTDSADAKDLVSALAKLLETRR
jgi:GAF domain-containing protein